MIGLQGFMLPEKYAKYLHSNAILFGKVYQHIDGKAQTTVYIILGFIITLKMTNSMHKIHTFKPSKYNLIFSIIIFFSAVSIMSQMSEFLYFNF